MRNVTGDPWAGVAKDELFDLTPYAGAYVRYFVRHPTTQAMPRKVKTSFDGGPRDRAISGIHDVAFRARVREIEGRGEVRGVRDAGRRRHLDHAAQGAGAVRVPGARQRRIPEGHRGGHADLRPPGVAARQPRPRADQGVRRQVRHRGAAQAGRGGDAGRVGRRTRLLDRAAPVRRRRARGRARAAAELRQPERRRLGVRALPRRQRARAEAGGLRDRRGEGHPRRPHARAVQGPRGDHALLRRRLRAHHRAAELRPALGARGVRVRPVAGARRSSASATRARAKSTTSCRAPARTRASSGSPARWG